MSDENKITSEASVKKSAKNWRKFYKTGLQKLAYIHSHPKDDSLNSIKELPKLESSPSDCRMHKDASNILISFHRYAVESKNTYLLDDDLFKYFKMLSNNFFIMLDKRSELDDKLEILDECETLINLIYDDIKIYTRCGIISVGYANTVIESLNGIKTQMKDYTAKLIN